MQRTLNAFENAFDRLAAGYFLVIALAVAAAVVAWFCKDRLLAVGGRASDPQSFPRGEPPAVAFADFALEPVRAGGANGIRTR
jgi:hypothetical protein